MTATKAAKCAHSVCSCQTTSGKFCSTQCEAMAKTPDIDCSCGHIECTGNLLTLNSARIDNPSRVYHQKKMRNLRRAFARLAAVAQLWMALATFCRRSAGVRPAQE